MRKFFVFAAVLFGHAGSSQTSQLPTTVKVNDYSVKIPQNKRYLDAKGAYKLANRVFGQVASRNDGVDLANYATFEPLNGSFKFNGFAALNKQDKETQRPAYASLSLAGDLLSNNVGVLFSNAKLNTNVNADLKFHFALKNFTYSYFTKDARDMIVRKEELRAKAIYDLQKLDYDIQHVKRSTAILQEKKKSLNSKISDQETKLTNAVGAAAAETDTEPKEKMADSATRTRMRIEKWREEVFALDNQIAAQSNLYNRLIKESDEIQTLRQEWAKEFSQAKVDKKTQEYIENNTQELTDKILEDYEARKVELDLKARLASFSMKWVSVNIGFNKKKFYTFFDNLAFDNQIEKRELDAFVLGAAYNYYRQNTNNGRIFYWNLGLNRMKGNNTESLSTTKVVDERVITAGETKRKILTEYNAFTKPIEEFRSWQVYTNAYYLFGDKSFSGFHLFPEYMINDGAGDVSNLGLGYLISFKNQKDEKAVVNIEFFLKLKDLSNKLDSELNLIKRSEIGVSFTLPFGTYRPLK